MSCTGSTFKYDTFLKTYQPETRELRAIFEKTNVMIRMKVVVRSFGPPYTDRVQGEECWDIMAVSETEKKVAIRLSLNVYFHDRPALVAG